MKLFVLKHQFPLSFSAVALEEDLGTAASHDAQLTGISFCPSAHVAWFSDGAVVYRENEK